MKPENTEPAPKAFAKLNESIKGKQNERLSRKAEKITT
eukprot:CAMPEP_0180555962 /NCGR_PEP_ID=MMETSP1037_2-20121125/299_1 /TAXON_ID=632150 /ORGANISM="Azadinium spinosum, Strain 3D9" /LENGTH=37 /DNA_ID= /DNA_START= /DNA_END= /DNA_ORIENTATION=